MEYIRIYFNLKDIRDVIANGDVIGQTDTEITLPSNYYVISISGSGYSPPFWYGVVSNTSASNPLKIQFNRT
jgi:hypothetical protein